MEDDRPRTFRQSAASAGRELWEKVREYVETGTEEASRLTATARLRVDMETLRYRRRGLFKELGKRVYAGWEQGKGEPVPGTDPILRDLRELDEEIRELARQVAELEEKGREG